MIPLGPTHRAHVRSATKIAPCCGYLGGYLYRLYLCVLAVEMPAAMRRFVRLNRLEQTPLTFDSRPRRLHCCERKIYADRID